MGNGAGRSWVGYYTEQACCKCRIVLIPTLKGQQAAAAAVLVSIHSSLDCACAGGRIHTDVHGGREDVGARAGKGEL